MSEDTTKAFQSSLASRLSAIFGTGRVAVEWSALQGEGAQYSPRVDVAVGPFAIGNARLESDYDQMLTVHQHLLHRLHEHNKSNVRQLSPSDDVTQLQAIAHHNPNARCFLAIEIEKTGSRKHIMGGAINAAALGRLGMSVAWTSERLRALLKMRRYLLFLARVGKNAFDPTNLLILSREQLDAVV